MKHPLHRILKRWLESEQFAFDVNAREYWQIVPWPIHERETGGQPGDAPRPNRGNGTQRESEVPS